MLVPVLGERKALALIVLLVCFCLLVSTSGIVFASSGNWVEVTRFTDEGINFPTDTFTIDHVEWRIRWEYEPLPEVPEEHPTFYVYVYAQEYPGTWFESIEKRGSEETNGTLYIHDRNGTFFLMIIRAVQSYTLIIEQDLTSIPEFPSWTILPIVLLVTLVVMVYKKKLSNTSMVLIW